MEATEGGSKEKVVHHADNEVNVTSGHWSNSSVALPQKSIFKSQHSVLPNVTFWETESLKG